MTILPRAESDQSGVKEVMGYFTAAHWPEQNPGCVCLKSPCSEDMKKLNDL